jgi:pSer/pThr/pTyr-binding forkhead associated (FHA) protein
MDSFAIGRGPRNQLSLADTSVSREHCVILRQGDNFLIRDLENFHGTLVNDTRVMERMLANGDCIQLGRSLLRFLTDDDVVCQETSEDARTIEIPADQTQLPATLENSRDLHTLLRMSIMLHSFQALYKVRRSPARSTLERHLLEFIFEVIPSNRGAILLYEGDSSEPSSLSVRSEESAPHRPVVINRTLVRRVMQERCGLIVENLEAEQSAGAGSGKSAALLLVPLLIREQVYGIVYLEGTAFSEPDLQLLVAIAQIA